MRLSVVIPVYNERDTIEEILSRVKAVPGIEKEIIVVDDASKDGTTSVLQRLEKENPDIKFVYKPENRGKGHTLKIGFQNVTGDYVVVQDADLEYDPLDYINLLKPINDKRADVVYGSRFSGNYKDMSTLHYFGNKILTMATNLLYGVMLTDMETCYKMVPASFIKTLDIKSERFDFEPEITAKILKSGLRIVEVPIAYKGRTHSQGKKITWKDGVGAVWSLIKYRFQD